MLARRFTAGRNCFSLRPFGDFAWKNSNPFKNSTHCAECAPGVRHALLPPAADGSFAPCGAELFLFSCAEEAPHPIRQSRSHHRREQSFAHSGVRHALLPPAGDGCSAPCGAELYFSCTEEAPARTRQSRSSHRREQSFAHSGVRHALLPPAAVGSSAPCGAELYFSCTEEAPLPHATLGALLLPA
jgi:hypothetical protein